MTRTKLFLLGVLLGGLLTGFIVYKISAVPQPKETKYVYSNRREPPRIKVPPLRPATVYLYRVRTDTVRISLPVPRDFGRPIGVLRPNFISVRRRAVSVDYWSPDSLRYVREKFVIPEPTWGFELSVGGGVDNFGSFSAGPELDIRRKSWTATFGVAQTTDGTSYSVGLRKRIFGF